MAVQYKALTELYRETQHRIMNPEQWLKFLTSACRNYRLTFDEQLLIYAQRPDATAVLDIESWNRRFGRWVNRGATGIAVFDGDHNGRSRLKYYFDISDTHESRMARPVPLWEVKPEYEAEIIENLENNFGELAKKEDLAGALLSAAKNAVEDHMPDYLTELLGCTTGSILEELDNFKVESAYRRALENSVGYMLLIRCGLPAEEYFTDEDFRGILDFNTRETVNALGVATCDIAEMGLTKICMRVRDLKKQEKIQNRTFAKKPQTQYPVNEDKGNSSERSFKYEADIQNAGRLQSAEPFTPAGSGGTPWEVCIAAPEVSERTPQDTVHELADLGQAERPSDGDRADSTFQDGAVDGSDSTDRGRDGGTESKQPNEVGGLDEQYPPLSGGNHSKRADLQLEEEKDQSADSSQAELPALLDEKLIMEVISNKDDNLNYKKQQIELFFSVHPDEEERAEYLKSAYQNRYTEILVGGIRAGYKPQGNGLLMWEGAYLSRTKESVFSWNIIVEWTAQLIEKKEYYINTDIKGLKNQESQQMSLFDFADFNAPAEEKEQVSLFPRFEISQQVIDEALCIGANDQNSRLIICAYFMKDKADNARFLQEHYGIGGAGFYFNNRKISIWYNAEGLRIAEGESAQRSSATLLSWEQAAKRIRELLDLGRYMSQGELDQVSNYEVKQFADRLLLMFRDIEDEGKHFFPTLHAIYDAPGGFPEMTAKVVELLNQPAGLQSIVSEYTPFASAYEEDHDIMRFHFYRPLEIQKQLKDLQREPIMFAAAKDYNPKRSFFITKDEIDNILRGGKNSTEYRLAVYSFYRTHPDRKDRENFLKNYHGEYSGSHSGNNNLTYQKGTGLLISHGNISKPYAKVELKWNDIEKRISALITSGKFIFDDDRDAIPQYEKRHLAQDIQTFFRGVQEQPRPVAYGFNYWDAVKVIELQLDDPIKVEEIYQMMLPIWEATSQDDRNYKCHKEIFANLAAFRNGTFTLFAERKEPISPVTVVSEQPKKEEMADPFSVLATKILHFIWELNDSRNNMGYGGTEVEALDNLTCQLHNEGQRKEILALLQSFLDHTEIEEEIANELTLCMERLQELPQEVSFKQDQRAEITGDQEEAGWTVSEELIEQNLKGYMAHRDKGDNQDVADFIENEILSDQDELAFSDIENELPAEKENSLAPPNHRHKRSCFAALHPEIPAEQRHNFRITNKELGYGSPSEKYAANAAAIRCLKQIEYEDRLATSDEQITLSRYIGWGGLSDCFDERNSHYREMKSLLDSEEYSAARASSLTAFYTSPFIIDAIYQALMQMGFHSGNLLEPACGVGNFIGRIPESMNCKVYGVEIDSISGRIAQQLYQNSSIAVEGFEKVEMPDSFFDAAVGNVPFGDFKVLDRRYDKHHWQIHDYFFGKTLDKVRPGGIVAFITSKGTLDKGNSAVRKYLAQRADLIGAIRLPDNAFLRNAGTEVTSDIIFLQKRDRLVDIEPDWVHLDTDQNGIKINSYFVQHPEMVLGEMKMESTRFGMDSACKAYEHANLSKQLVTAINNLHAQITEYEVDELEDKGEDLSIPADPDVRNFSYTVVEGSLYFRENSRMYRVNASVTAENRIRGMIALRDCVRRLIEYQTENYPDEIIKREQKKLNTLYDNYVKKYDRLYTRGNNLAFCEDSSYSLLCSLEILNDEGNFKRKADMFSKRTIRPHVPVTHVDTASEALAVSISEKAQVDLEYMSILSGKTPEELEKELKGVIFRDIACAEQAEDIPAVSMNVNQFRLVVANEYLSGKVRQKLRMAQALYEVLPAEKKVQVEPNIQALQAVQPKDLTAGEIGVRIGATWVPAEIYKQFMFELFDTGYYAKCRMNILYSKYNGEWNIIEKNSDHGNIKAITAYGTKRMSAYQIFEQTLNLKDVRIFDYVEDENGNKKAVLCKKETAIAQDKQELIKQKFSEWIWKDIDRRDQLCKIYNETFNAIRPREYDGSHIVFNGMNPEITLRTHQINAIAHIMYGGNTLLAHEVGAGKTYEMVAAAMEMKRLGLCTKSLIVVPNHITEQWAAEWLQLYPSANILVATKKDFERQNRRKFCGRIATGDYDAVIIGHSQLEKIPMSAEQQRVILQQQIEEILFGLREAKAAKAERYTVKQMERARKSLEQRIAKLNDQSRKDDLVTFEELGCDRIFIDESHYFKNLFLATKMRNVGGIAQTEAQKSSDLFMKTQYLDEMTDGRGTIFATGTPISNSMVELYTIQRYLQYRTLQETSMVHFDEWAANFGETITAIELSPEGNGYRAKTRFAKFYNLPELMSMFKETADIQTADMLKLPVPKANFHTEVIKPSALQQEMIKGLAKRAEEIRNGNVDPSVDNMLKITNDGRKLALDMRLINPLATNDENGKVSICARNVFDIWERTTEQSGAQLVFCDLSTPKGDGSFNIYDDLKTKLVEKGVLEEEIAFIHTANTEAKKKELFAKVRSGQVRILIGSTQKMGAGTNVQDRLVALHDLDCPWRPSDLAQRLGRIVRQGNRNAEVDIYRYVTENTFDAYLYQLVENKQKFIAQIMTSKTPLRAAEDVDETALSYSEIKALATGNPLIIEKCDLDMQVGKLNMLKANHLNQRYALEELVYRKYPSEIIRIKEKIEGLKKDIELVNSYPKPQQGFPGMVICDQDYADKEQAGKAILDACSKIVDSESIQLGQYRGFIMTLVYDNVFNVFYIALKGMLSHTVTLGTDVFGNITRLDNTLSNLPNTLRTEQEELSNVEKQLDNAKVEMEAPFVKEAELTEKIARLKELNILLNLNSNDREIVDAEPDESANKEKRRAENVR